jgi:phosphatidylinositol 3-kinase
VCVEGQLCSYGEGLAIPMRTPWADATQSGATWDAWLDFPVKYRDLGHDAQLALTVWEVREGEPRRPLGGTTLRLFSKKGRLKSGPQELQLWLGRPADTVWPSSTPGKVAMAQRGELG